METSFGMISDFKSFSLAPDSNNQIFGLLDEINDSFQNHLQDIQSNNDKLSQENLQKRKATIAEQRKPISWHEQAIAESYSTNTQRFKSVKESRNSSNHPKETSKPQNMVVQDKGEKSSILEKNSKSSEQKAIELPRIHPRNINRVMQGLQDFAQGQVAQHVNYSKLSSQLINAIHHSNHKGVTTKNSDAPKLSINQSHETTKEDKKVSEKRAVLKPNDEYRHKMETLKSKLANQVKFQLKMAFKKGIGNVNVKLKPHILGNMRIHVNLNAAEAQAHFLVENQTVKELLKDSEAELKDKLKGHGINLKKLGVDTLGDHENRGEGGQAFSTFEDRKAVKNWLQSFKKDHEESSLVKKLDEEIDEEVVIESEDLFDVIA